MGGHFSVPDNFNFCCLIPQDPNKLVLLHADEKTIDTVRENILWLWSGSGTDSKGIEKEDEDGSSYCFYLKGRPFSEDGTRGESIILKYLCCTLLSSMYQEGGWRLMLSSDLTLTGEHTTWFFCKRHKIDTEDPMPKLTCLSLYGVNKLQLIYGASDLYSTLKEVVGQCIEEKVGSDYEFQLPAQPWVATAFAANVKATHLLLEIVRQFNTKGYKWYGVANLRGSADCIFFQRVQNEEPDQLAFMSLNGTQYIRFFGMSKDIVDDIRLTIEKNWTAGVEPGRLCKESLCEELRFEGEPWSFSETNPYGAQFMLSVVLQKLLSIGWSTVDSFNMSSNGDSKSLFVLRQSIPKAVPHFVLIPDKEHGLVMIGAPENLNDLLLKTVKDTFSDCKIEGKASFLSDECPLFQLQIDKNIWSSTNEKETLLSRHLMCLLMHQFESQGWHVVASADVSSAARSLDDSSDLDTWFFAYFGKQSTD